MGNEQETKNLQSVITSLKLCLDCIGSDQFVCNSDVKNDLELLSRIVRTLREDIVEQAIEEGIIDV